MQGWRPGVIAELFLYLTSGASRVARRSGLLTLSIGLWSRANRRRREWAPHYARCHGFIRETLADLPAGRKAVILGSGLVEDVPLDLLAARYQNIVLVDIVHLKPVMRRIGRNPRLAGKVSFLTRDLTGLLEALQAGHVEQAPDRVNPIADLEADQQVDLVISAMCLSQLPRAVDKLLAGSAVPEDAAEAICRSVVESHLRTLQRFSGTRILLSDTAFLEIPADGSTPRGHDLLWGVSLPPPDAQWEWDVAPRGEASRKLGFLHQVGAWRNLQAHGTLPSR